MNIILASSFNMTEKDEDGNRHPTIITDTNCFLNTIKRLTPKHDRLVIVANDPNNFEVNDYRFDLQSKSLALSGLDFKEKILLDSRNKNDAKSIIESADLILLSGGKLECQLDFFHEIELKTLITNHPALIMGGSAGAMNLCKVAFNYPEYAHEVDPNKTEFFLPGLGFHNEILVPHLDDKTNPYLNDGFDPVAEFILPKSHGREFLAFNDDSYILIENGVTKYFGNFYRIKDGIIKQVAK